MQDEETTQLLGKEKQVGHEVMLPVDASQKMHVVDTHAWLQRMDTLVGVEDGIGCRLTRRRSSVY